MLDSLGHGIMSLAFIHKLFYLSILVFDTLRLDVLRLDVLDVMTFRFWGTLSNKLSEFGLFLAYEFKLSTIIVFSKLNC